MAGCSVALPTGNRKSVCIPPAPTMTSAWRAWWPSMRPRACLAHTAPNLQYACRHGRPMSAW